MTAGRHPMHGPNRLKLGIFSANAEGGLALTRAPERWPARWPQIVEAARIADRAGLEFFLPIARWKGYGGVTNSREWSFETLTHAAALAGVTERIALFATVHVPMVHPVFAAKALATIDHASNGRAGLNIVCGWHPEEFAMFGAADDRGTLRPGPGMVRNPAPHLHRGGAVRLPRPLLRPAQRLRAAAAAAAAAAGDAERRLLARRPRLRRARRRLSCSPPSSRSTTAAPRSPTCTPAPPRTGRSVGVYATAHVVCRPTQSEAEDYYEWYAVTMEDTAAADHYMGTKEKFSGSHDPLAYRLHRKRFVGGGGTFPLVGTPHAHRRAIAADQRGRLRRRGAVLRELSRRAAVFHRDGAAAAARGGAARRAVKRQHAAPVAAHASSAAATRSAPSTSSRHRPQHPRDRRADRLRRGAEAGGERAVLDASGAARRRRAAAPTRPSRAAARSLRSWSSSASGRRRAGRADSSAPSRPPNRATERANAASASARAGAGNSANSPISASGRIIR